MTINHTIKKTIVLLIAIQPERIYATVNGIIIMAHGRKAVVKYNLKTKLFSVGIIAHLGCKEVLIKDIPLDRVLEVVYRHLGKHPNFFKYMAAWL